MSPFSLSHPSVFADVPAAPPDPILGLTEKFLADSNLNKVNLGVGVYQNADGKVPLLKAVHEAESRLLDSEGAKSYLPIDGLKAYNQAVQTLLFGADSSVVSEGRAVTAQALGGTGGLKVGADFLKRFVSEGAAPIYISDPSWENHRALFEFAGFDVRVYPYYDGETQSVRFGALIETLQNLPAATPVVLHACCHNPTGLDLTPEQWRNVAETCAARELLPFLDFAYQGFAEGPEPDAYAIRLFTESGLPFLIAQSFSKSFSLYRERVGSLTVVTKDADEARRVLSQVKRVVRTNYSSPASHGGQVVAAILADAELTQLWESELTEMRERIQKMRLLFVEKLRQAGASRDFGFIAEQRGMFSYSGLTKAQAERLRDEFHVYVVDSGRICVAALNEKNLDAVCAAIASVL